MNAGASSSHVSAMFLDTRKASRAVEALMVAGFRRDDISLLMSDRARARHFPEEPTKAPRGAAMGGSLGAVAGGLVALVSLASPGGIAVTGPLMALLTGGTVGALSGGLLGALVGAGFPTDLARRYERWIIEGGMVVGVQCKDDEHARGAVRILEAAGAARPLRHTRGRSRARTSQPVFAV